jgi:hypothetical protein
MIFLVQTGAGSLCLAIRRACKSSEYTFKLRLRIKLIEDSGRVWIRDSFTLRPRKYLVTELTKYRSVR